MNDYAWWSGLTTADAKAGAETATPWLAREVVGGKTYFFEDGRSRRVEGDGTVHLLPNFDEYAVAYVDRGTLLEARHRSKLDALGNVLFQNLVVRAGRIVGTWRRTLKRSTVSVATTLFVRFGVAEKRALAEAVERYAHFMGREVA